MRWLLLSAAIHALVGGAIALGLGASDPAPDGPAAIRVQLWPTPDRSAPGPPEPHARSSAAPASGTVAPATEHTRRSHPVADPGPSPSPPPSPRRVAAPPPAPSTGVEPPKASPSSAAATREEAGADHAGAAAAGTTDVSSVSSAPPGGTGEAGLGPGRRDAVADYIAEIRALLMRHQRYPSIARRRGLEARVLLRVRIAADGRLETVATDGAAPQLFAKSALAAVERAGRFPVPPHGALSVEVPMRFRLRP